MRPIIGRHYKRKRDGAIAVVIRIQEDLVVHTFINFPGILNNQPYGQMIKGFMTSWELIIDHGKKEIEEIIKKLEL